VEISWRLCRTGKLQIYINIDQILIFAGMFALLPPWWQGEVIGLYRRAISDWADTESPGQERNLVYTDEPDSWGHRGSCNPAIL